MSQSSTNDIIFVGNWNFCNILDITLRGNEEFCTHLIIIFLSLNINILIIPKHIFCLPYWTRTENMNITYSHTACMVWPELTLFKIPNKIWEFSIVFVFWVFVHMEQKDLTKKTHSFFCVMHNLLINTEIFFSFSVRVFLLQVIYWVQWDLNLKRINYNKLL